MAEHTAAAIVWCDHATERVAHPYEPGELAAARAQTQRLTAFNSEAIEAAGVAAAAKRASFALNASAASL